MHFARAQLGVHSMWQKTVVTFRVGSDGVVGSKSHTADRVATSAMHLVCPYLAAGPRTWQGGQITESNQEGSKGAFRLSHGGPG